MKICTESEEYHRAQICRMLQVECQAHGEIFAWQLQQLLTRPTLQPSSAQVLSLCVSVGTIMRSIAVQGVLGLLQ